MGAETASPDPQGKSSNTQGQPNGKKETLRTKLQDYIKKSKNVDRVVFSFLGFISVILSVALVGVAVVSVIAAGLFFSVLVGRVVAMAALSFTGFLTFVTSIIAMMKICRRNHKHLRLVAFALLVSILVQLVVLSSSVKVTQKDENRIVNDMVNTVGEAQQGKLKQIRHLNSLQFELQCCGVFGPNDYFISPADSQNQYYSADIPASCCPTYDINNPDNPQDNVGLECKAKRSYYQTGCHTFVSVILKKTAESTLAVTVLLLIFEIFDLAFVVLVFRQSKWLCRNDDTPSDEEDGPDALSGPPGPSLILKASTTPAPSPASTPTSEPELLPVSSSA